MNPHSQKNHLLESLNDVWGAPAPIRTPHQDRQRQFKVLKPEFDPFTFVCAKNQTKWVRFLPNAAKSAYAGQWILSYRVVNLPNLAIIDPEFYTKRTSPFAEFHSRLKHAPEEISRLKRSSINPEGISTWPRDMGLARVLEIPETQSEPARLSILQGSMHDGQIGTQGFLFTLIQMAQATKNDPSLPAELRGTPKYPYSIVDAEHGRMIGLSRTNTYTATISEQEDFLTLIQRLTPVIESNPNTLPLIKAGLEDLLYRSTEEEAHQLLQENYPDVYPLLFPERITRQSNGLLAEHAKSAAARNGGSRATTPQNPADGNGHSAKIADAVKRAQEEKNAPPPLRQPENQQPNSSNDLDPLFENEVLSKAPPADFQPTLSEDEILSQLLSPETEETADPAEPVQPYENKVHMVTDFQKLQHLEPNQPEYQKIKRQTQASLHLLSQLSLAQIASLQKIIGAEKYADVTASSANQIE